MKEKRQVLPYTGDTGNYWLDGIMGVVTGDALGCPVQFLSREEVRKDPVRSMQGYGTYLMPEGTWTDDSSLTLAALDSIRNCGTIDLRDMMERFVSWYKEGSYTPFGVAFDVGRGTRQAIERYRKEKDPEKSGGTKEHDNGNGSLMRILPVCLWCYQLQKTEKLSDREITDLIHRASGLTHAHLRSRMACGLYFFMARAVLDQDDDLIHRLQQGLDEGFGFYRAEVKNLAELSNYGRLKDLFAFYGLPESGIRSSGYVVDSLEAAVWSLVHAGSFKDTLLTAVNLGGDTDTIGAIAGGLAGLYYGYEDIPEEWLSALQRRTWVESLCF